MASRSASLTEEKSLFAVVVGVLQNTKFGDDIQDPARFQMKPRVLTSLIRNLVMLLENGLSLPKALATLADEPSLKKYGWMLKKIRRDLETGSTFSNTLRAFPKTFSDIIIGQIEVGEKSGGMVATLRRISSQFERSGDVRKKIMKRLSYPAMIMMAGAGLVVFYDDQLLFPNLNLCLRNPALRCPGLLSLSATAASSLLTGAGWLFWF